MVRLVLESNLQDLVAEVQNNLIRCCHINMRGHSVKVHKQYISFQLDLNELKELV